MTIWFGHGDAESPRRLVVEDVLRARHLDLQVMVAGAQGADLVEAALDGPVTDFRRIGAGKATLFLGPLQVLRPAIAVSKTPAGALLRNGAEFVMSELDEAVAADAGREPGERDGPRECAGVAGPPPG